MSDRREWNAWGDTPEPIAAPKDGTLSLIWMRLRRLGSTRPATPTDDMEGQVRYERDGSVDGKLWLARCIAAGTYEWQQLNNPALADLSDVTAVSPGAIAGKVLAWDGSAWDDSFVYTETLGPWYLNDVPGTATTAMGRLYFDTATSIKMSTNRLQIGRAGYIVGARITSDDARTAGTCTVEVDLSGVSTAFDAGSVALDGTRTTQDASIVAPASGVAVTSGSDTIGVNLVTSGWTPTTANIQVTLVMMYAPIG